MKDTGCVYHIFWSWKEEEGRAICVVPGDYGKVRYPETIGVAVREWTRSLTRFIVACHSREAEAAVEELGTIHDSLPPDSGCYGFLHLAPPVRGIRVFSCPAAATIPGSARVGQGGISVLYDVRLADEYRALDGTPYDCLKHCFDGMEESDVEGLDLKENPLKVILRGDATKRTYRDALRLLSSKRFSTRRTGQPTKRQTATTGLEGPEELTGPALVPDLTRPRRTNRAFVSLSSEEIEAVTRYFSKLPSSAEKVAEAVRIFPKESVDSYLRMCSLSRSRFYQLRKELD